MIIKITALFFVFSFFGALIFGRAENLVSSFFGGGVDAVDYCIKVGGSICLFSGFMRVAEDCGITERFSVFLTPFVKNVIPGALVSAETLKAAVMNLASNMLGLGNAATPFGIKAARNIYTLNGMKGPDRSLASFIILNTSSLCFIPSTVIALRRAYGSTAPGDILLPVILVQLLSCTFGLVLVRAVFDK